MEFTSGMPVSCTFWHWNNYRYSVCTEHLLLQTATMHVAN